MTGAGHHRRARGRHHIHGRTGRGHVALSHRDQLRGFRSRRAPQRKLAQAALAAGVTRYFPWQFGVDYDEIGRGSAQPLFDEQLDVRDLLRGQSATEWVIVSTGMFAVSCSSRRSALSTLATNTVHAGQLDNEVTLTTPEDIGVLTTDIVFAEPRIRNSVVYLTGDTIGYRELADIVERVSGTAVTRSVDDGVPCRAVAPGSPRITMRKYRAVFARSTGVAWPKSPVYNAARGSTPSPPRNGRRST